jgi:hypothetical protein
MSLRIAAAIVMVTALMVVGTGAQQAAGVLLFEIGIHVEPFGLSNGQISTGRGTYADEAYYRRHAQYLRELAAIVERRGGRLTIQVQSPFIDYAPQYDNVIGELAANGHEIGFHFHEDAHLGRNADSLSLNRWVTVVQAQVDMIKGLGVERVRMWSGGNLYPRMLQVAAATGIDVKADWKDPRTQQADPRLKTTMPWRPAGSPDGSDLTLFVSHDPDGAMIFVPAGVIDPFGSVSDDIYATADPAAAVQEYWTDGLAGSLSSAAQSPSSTHTFHLTLHPGELQLNDLGGNDTLEHWLSQHIDPLLLQGKVRWATFSQMADTYAANGR